MEQNKLDEIKEEYEELDVGKFSPYEQDKYWNFIESKLKEVGREAVVGWMKFVIEYCEENHIYIPDYLDGEYNVLPNTALEQYLQTKAQQDKEEECLTL